MEGRVTCNEEKCQQSLETVQVHTEPPTTTAKPVLIDNPSLEQSPISSRREIGVIGEIEEKGLPGNVGAPGEAGRPGIPGSPGSSGQPPDMTYYSRQLADVLSSSDKGPSSGSSSFLPDQFQYLQAQVGPVGARGPPGPSGILIK